MSEARSIPCPICKKPVAFTDPQMPFCSERCRLIDLGMWADEAYRIEEPLKDFDPDQPPGSRDA